MKSQSNTALRAGTLRVRSLEHRCQVALQLDLELSLFRCEDDSVDKAAQCFSGGGTALFVSLASGQLRHLLSVKVRHVRVEQGRRLSRSVQAGAKLYLLRLQGNQWVLDDAGWQSGFQGVCPSESERTT